MTNAYENVWIWRGVDFWRYRVPLAICGAEEIGQNRWRGELFVVLEGREPQFIRKAFEFSSAGAPEEIATQPAEFMREELLRLIDGIVSGWRMQLFDQTGLKAFLDPIPLEEGSRNDLYRLKIQSKFDADLELARGESQISNLKSLLEIVMKISASIRPG